MKSFTKRIILTGLIVAAAIVSVAFQSNAQAAQNCDNNAVMYCGASNISTLQNKYHNGVSGHNTANSIQHIYSYFGISGGDINSMGQYAVAGEVYRDGTVKVDGKVVATDAWTAGRENISGSTKVTYAGTTFYKRRPAVSFVSSPLSA